MDIDLILGKLNKILSPNLLQTNDFISAYTDYASGPFFILRNNEQMNLLFTQVPEFKEIFSNSKYCGFDEHIIKKRNIGFSLRKGFYFVMFILVSY